MHMFSIALELPLQGSRCIELAVISVLSSGFIANSKITDELAAELSINEHLLPGIVFTNTGYFGEPRSGQSIILLNFISLQVLPCVRSSKVKADILFSMCMECGKKLGALVEKARRVYLYASARSSGGKKN